MGVYVVFSKLNSEGVKLIRERPERVAEVADELKAMGGRIIDQWALLGQYDFCALVEAPDDASLHRMTVEQAGGGRARFIAFPAIDMPLFVRLLGQSTETTGPHPWQIRFPVQVARRALRNYWITQHVRAACKPLTILGRANLKDLPRPAIFIANHSSHLDSLVVHTALPEPHRKYLTFGSAADRFYIKGRKGMTKQGWWNSLAMNTFPIRRGAGRSTLAHAEWLIDKRWNVMIFPEGTRSTSGRMGTFKAGVAILALAKGVPVVPMYLEGLAAIRPKGTRDVQPGPVRVLIGEPIRFPEGTSVGDATQTMHRAMEALRLDLRASRPTPAEGDAAAG
ncbi:MAG: 1-acyl-sn-glycerol-3-phosphate acyltransferase [Dehalococcoidia bacterium]